MSTALGKRKQRDEDGQKHGLHGSTLFVSNLPYTATSTDLQTLFSDIAPVRSAFVVTEPGSGVSKGVGYVSFAIKEDAESSFAKIAEEGITLVGRKLRVQWAESKPKEPREMGDAATVKKEPKSRPPPRPHVPHDPLAIRTIIISGLPPAIDSKVLWKKIRKYEGAEKVDWPLKNNETGQEDLTTAHVLFTTPSSALDAIHKLHAHIYKGCLLSATLKKRRDTLAKPSAPSKKDAAEPSHASRLIVRNIPFNATEQDLRAVFLPYGPIHSVHIPTSQKVEEEEGENAPRKPRTKGFAFVWMLSRKDAERAIEGCNGITVRAGTAETLVLDKQKRKKQRRIEMKMKAADNEEEDEEMAEEKEEVVDDKRATERVIAVDWALSKDKWKEEKAKMTEDVDMDEGSSSDEDSDRESDDDENSDSDSNSDDSNDDDLGVHPTTDADNSDDEETPTKPTLPPPEAGTTLFIRNLPFSATDEDLRALFRTFGPLRYARITIDPSSGRSRGTGFACFWNVEDADRVVSLSEEVRTETGGVSTTSTTITQKKNPFVLPSILTPDPSSSLARSLVLHGRTLDVVRAVTRDVAGRLREEGERMREKADKRNMYLLREGVIMPNTPSAQYLTPAEVEKRTSSFNARRALLKSNPSLFISKTRLSIRQIPIFVTERMLKRLSSLALKAFEDEVKNGSRVELTPDELASDKMADDDDDEKAQQDAEEEEGDKKKKKKKTKKKHPSSSPIKQTKIVRQLERVDPVTGKGRSKGYGFVEMHKHSDAFRLLRWANNNPEVGTLFEEWWGDELEMLLKLELGKQKQVEGAKEGGGRDEARVKRIKDELEGVKSGEGGKKRKAKGTLIVEFSIENVQVVQRRKAALERSLQTSDSKLPHKKHEQSSTAAAAVEKGGGRRRI